MNTPKRFQKKEYINWVKCNMAMTCMKEALHNYIDNGVKNLHLDIKQNLLSTLGEPFVGKTCGSCAGHNVRKDRNKWSVKCKNSVCDKWLSEILTMHINPQVPSINWRNADISRWPTDPYEVAKVFMPKGQNRHKKLPQELDVPAVLSLLKYCTWFSTKIPNVSLLSELIDIRNEVLHSGEFEVQDGDRNSHIDKMIQLLHDLKINGGVESELEKIKCEDIDMAFKDSEIKALQNVVSDLRSKFDDTEEGKKVLQELKQSYGRIELFLNNNPDIDDIVITNNMTALKIFIEEEISQVKVEVSSYKDRLKKHETRLEKHEDRLDKLEKGQLQLKEMGIKHAAFEASIPEVTATCSGASSNSMKSNKPTTPSNTRVHSIASLTPYLIRWRICARVTRKSHIHTWTNNRGEGRLFFANLADNSGEIKATGFNDVVDKLYNLLEFNKVFYISKATVRIADKQYSSLKNHYEIKFHNYTCIEPCDDIDLPTITFNFVKINELEKIQPNGLADVIGIMRRCGDVSKVIGKKSQRKIAKRNIQLVDQSEMVVALALWGTNAENFDGSGNPVLAILGASVSYWGGRSLSVLASSQLMVNPDIPEAHLLRGWYDKEGGNMDFTGFKSEMGSGGGNNWKFFSQVKSENLGQGDKADYFTCKGTVIFLHKENCMYQACPTETCNKKVIDQGNGMFRCEKCNREFPDFKWRMILSVNLADFSDNQWVTCFYESAETILGKTAAELGHLRESNEAAFDQVFQDALFKSYVIKLRAKVETYNDESRLKTVCTAANPIDWKDHGRCLIEDIHKMIDA